MEFGSDINLCIHYLLTWTKCTFHPPHDQSCQCRGLPAQLGYFEITYHGSKNCWVGGLKLGYFSSFNPRQLFFLQICQFSINSESLVLSLFNVQEHCFHQFRARIQGLRRPGEQSISIIHLHVEVNNVIVFPPNWVILIILGLKSTQIWEIRRVIT